MLSEQDLKIASELAMFIANSEGGFFIVESNDATKDREFLSRLKRIISKKSITVDFLDCRKPSFFFTKLKNRLAQENSTNVVYVINLYNITANKENAISFARDLNYNRDIYFNYGKVIVFFFPVFFVDIIIAHARDFYDYVSSTFNISTDNVYSSAEQKDFADERQLKNRISFLENLVKNNKFLTSQDKLDKLAELGNSYLKLFNINSALRVLGKGLRLSIKLENRNRQAYFLHNLGYAHSFLGRNRRALKYIHAALDIYEEINDKSNIAGMLNNLSNLYINDGKVDVAKECLEKSYKVFCELNDIKNQIMVLVNKADIQRRNRNFNETLDTLDYALKLMKQSENIDNYPKIVSMIAHINAEIGQFESAVKLYEQAIYLFSVDSDKEGLAYVYNKISILHRQRGEYERAKEYSLQALQIVREIQSKRGEALTLLNLANLFMKLGDVKSVYRYLDELSRLEVHKMDSRIMNAEKTLRDALKGKSE